MALASDSQLQNAQRGPTQRLFWFNTTSTPVTRREGASCSLLTYWQVQGERLLAPMTARRTSRFMSYRIHLATQAFMFLTAHFQARRVPVYTLPETQYSVRWSKRPFPSESAAVCANLFRTADGGPSVSPATDPHHRETRGAGPV